MRDERPLSHYFSNGRPLGCQGLQQRGGGVGPGGGVSYEVGVRKIPKIANQTSRHNHRRQELNCYKSKQGGKILNRKKEIKNPVKWFIVFPLLFSHAFAL